MWRFRLFFLHFLIVILWWLNEWIVLCVDEWKYVLSSLQQKVRDLIFLLAVSIDFFLFSFFLIFVFPVLQFASIIIIDVLVSEEKKWKEKNHFDWHWEGWIEERSTNIKYTILYSIIFFSLYLAYVPIVMILIFATILWIFFFFSVFVFVFDFFFKCNRVQ